MHKCWQKFGVPKTRMPATIYRQCGGTPSELEWKLVPFTWISSFCLDSSSLLVFSSEVVHSSKMFGHRGATGEKTWLILWPRQVLLLDWFSKTTGTSLDNGARRANTQIWSNWNRIQTILPAPTSSSDVPVLLLNQPIWTTRQTCSYNQFIYAGIYNLKVKTKKGDCKLKK